MTRPSSLADLASIYDSQPISGMRNRIINGDMRIDQRNSGGSITPTTSGDWWTVDRWRLFVNGTNASSRFSVQQSSVAPPGYTNSILFTSLGSYSVASDNNLTAAQIIEGLNCSDLGWGTASAQTVTLSFWARSSLTGAFGGSLRNSGSTRSYPFSYTINAANTWEYKTVIIPGDTSGTWLTTNGIGVNVSFNLGSGSTFLGTVNTWAGSNFTAPTGAVSLVGTNAATLHITGVQFEVGAFATPFERRSFGQELMLCQRYYEKSYNFNVVPGTITFDYAPVYVGTVPRQTYAYKVSKRAAATVTLFRPDQSNVTGQTTGGLTITVTESAAEGFATNVGGGAVTGDYRFNWVAAIEL